MSVHLTPAQARALGVETKTKAPKVRRTARGAYHTVCMACGTEFHTLAAEDRHLDETRHPRYQLVWGLA